MLPVKLNGALVVNKPSGPTSHDIVQKVRGLFRIKVGHTGTLDPMANGVLTLVLGRATRLARFLQSGDKEYLAEIRLGITTDTLDRDGRILEETTAPRIPPEQAHQVLSKFVGEIRQQTPLFSAVKVGGERLYKLARRNQQVQPPWRTVLIYRIDLREQSQETWKLDIHCSSGTYIRSLAHDIGQALGCGAHLQKLCRTRSGCFQLSRAIHCDQIESQWNRAFFPLEELLPELPRIDLNEQQSEEVRHGMKISGPEKQGKEFFRLFHDHSLIAIGKSEQDQLIHPVIVLHPA